MARHVQHGQLNLSILVDIRSARTDTKVFQHYTHGKLLGVFMGVAAFGGRTDVNSSFLSSELNVGDI